MVKSFFSKILVVCMVLTGGCSLFPEPSPPSEKILIEPSQVAFHFPPLKSKKAYLLWGEVQSETFLTSSKIFLKPSAYQLSTYQGVVWAYPPGKMVKKWIERAFIQTSLFEGVLEDFQETALPWVKLNLFLDAFWVDYTLRAKPCVRIKARLTLAQTSPKLFLKTTVFDIKIPLKQEDKRFVFQGFEEALQKLATETVLWVHTVFP